MVSVIYPRCVASVTGRVHARVDTESPIRRGHRRVRGKRRALSAKHQACLARLLLRCHLNLAEWITDMYWLQFELPLYRVAAQLGDDYIIDWLSRKGCHRDNRRLTHAIRYGHLDTARDCGFRASAEACAEASTHGHLDMLE